MKRLLAISIVLVAACVSLGAPPNPPDYVPFELKYDWIRGWERGVTGTGPNTGGYDFRIGGIDQKLPTATGWYWVMLMNEKLRAAAAKQAYIDGYNSAP